MRMKFLFFISILFITAGTFAADKSQDARSKKFLWVIAHEPIDLFKAAADQFSNEIATRSNGQIKIEVMTLPEYVNKFNNGKKISQKKFLNIVKSGKIQFSQTYTTELGKYNQDMYVLDLPFLFRNHEHAKNVLEGQIGEQLLAGMTNEHVRGLAFTYSGGYRILPSKRSIAKLEDFKGLRIRTSSSPVARETLKALGAVPVPMGLEDIETSMKSGKIVAAESTYPRFYSMKQNEVSPFVVESFHSLFLTTILINDDIWKSLSLAEQEIMKTAAINAARSERAKSLTDSDGIRTQCKKDGIKLVTFNEKEKDRLAKATESVYKKFDSIFKAGLVQSIVSTK